MGAVTRVKPRSSLAASSCAWIAAAARRRGFRLAGGTDPCVGQFGGNRVVDAQPLAPLGLAGSTLLDRAGLLQLGFQALDLRLEGTRVDLEQEVAFLHQGAFLERHLVDEAGDARADFHGFRRLQTSGEFVPFGDLMLDDLGDADCRWRGCRLRGLGRLAAPGGDDHDQRDQRETQGVEGRFHA